MAAHTINALVTGKVWKIERLPGQSVHAGDTVLILESMKMEIPMEAPVDGVVSELTVAEGDSVKEGQLLARLVNA